jgi:curli biogenesis system outer membrane secretion channel CsgG
MTRIRPAVLALGLSLVLAACQQQSAPTAANPPASAPAAASAAAPAPTRDAAPAATAGSIGIAECDDYLNKYQACVQSKVPEGTRAALIQSLDQTRAAWRTTLAVPGGKDSLAAACKQMRDATKASMSAYGCTDF